MLRLTVPLDTPDPRTLAAFKEYLPDAIRRAKGGLSRSWRLRLMGRPRPNSRRPSVQPFKPTTSPPTLPPKRPTRTYFFLARVPRYAPPCSLGRKLRSYVDVFGLADASGDAAAATNALGGGPSAPHAKRNAAVDTATLAL